MNHPLTNLISEIEFLQERIREKNTHIEALKAALREMLDAFYPFQAHNADIYARARAALAAEQRCARCGCETKGEAALMGDEEWCHPCADLAPEQNK